MGLGDGNEFQRLTRGRRLGRFGKPSLFDEHWGAAAATVAATKSIFIEICFAFSRQSDLVMYLMPVFVVVFFILQ